MKTWTVAAALLFVGTCGFAQTAETAPAARKSCDDFKAEIAKKLDAKGVTSYTLDVVDKGKEGDGNVVGGCDGGTRSIVYSRSSSPQAKASDEKKTNRTARRMPLAPLHRRHESQNPRFVSLPLPSGALGLVDRS
jgi:Protein of unknown function (DUF1161)